MATVTITLTSFQGALADCADAIVAKTWGTAWGHYAKAAAISAGLPIEVELPGNRKYKVRESLADLKSALETAQAAVTRADATGSRLTALRTGYRGR